MLSFSIGNEHKIWKKKNNKSWVAKGLHGFVVVSRLDFEVETLCLCLSSNSFQFAPCTDLCEARLILTLFICGLRVSFSWALRNNAWGEPTTALFCLISVGHTNSQLHVQFFWL
jgi:hypothetical protein